MQKHSSTSVWARRKHIKLSLRMEDVELGVNGVGESQLNVLFFPHPLKDLKQI